MISPTSTIYDVTVPITEKIPVWNDGNPVSLTLGDGAPVRALLVRE